MPVLDVKHQLKQRASAAGMILGGGLHVSLTHDTSPEHSFSIEAVNPILKTAQPCFQTSPDHLQREYENKN